LSEIEIIANRMLIIHKGKKVIEGEVKSLLDPSKSIVKIETTDNPTAFQLLEKSTWNENLKINERQIQLNIGKSAIPSLVRYLTENNIDIELIQPRHSLEDYFLTLTKTADNV
jgi:ABC-type multidrug transport system ATPase subunit